MLTYPAILRDNKNISICHVHFPNLDYECDLSYDDEKDLIHKINSELPFALWLYEQQYNKIPKPNTVSDKFLANNETIIFVSCDYDNFKNSIQIKEFDLSA